MALRATIFKANLAIADVDRGYYADHALTVAQHPSETDERLMVRLVAFALYADPALAFGAGLSSEDEPDLWLKDPTGAIRLWVDVGLPSEKDVRKACSRAERVVIFAYGRGAGVWWKQSAEALARFEHLTIIELDVESTRALAAIAARSMALAITIQEGEILVAGGADSLRIVPNVLRGAR